MFWGPMNTLEPAAVEERVEKLDPRHGQPCANENCTRTLVTGRIHAGKFCDANACGPRGLAGEITKVRKAEKAAAKAAKAAAKAASKAAKTRQAQQPWVDGARPAQHTDESHESDEPPPPPSLQLVKALRIIGVTFDDARLTLMDPDGRVRTLMDDGRLSKLPRVFHVFGDFRTERSRASVRRDCAWVNEDEMYDLLDPDEELDHAALEERLGELWHGPCVGAPRT